jgi:AsmA protein
LIIAGGLVVLLVSTAVVITAVVDPNRYKGTLESLLRDRVGRPVVIEGNLQISWFPWLGVRVGATHLANRPGDSGPPLIEWQSAAVAAKVMPLLRGEIEVDRVRLQSPQVRLRRDAQGRGNWEDLLGGSVAGAGAGSGAGVRSGAGAGSGAGAEPRAVLGSSRQQPAKPLHIAGLEIRDGSLSYLDESNGRQVSLSHVDFDMGAWSAGQSLPIHTRFLANSSSLPPAGVWIEIDTPALAVAGSSRQPLSVTASKLAVKVADAEVNGDLTYDQTADGRVSARGTVEVYVPSLRKLAAWLGLNQTMPHDPTTLGELKLTSNWNYENGLLAAKPVAVKLDGVTLEGWVEHSATPAPAWRFQLHGDRIDLGRYVNVDTSHNKPFELEMLNAINANGSLSFDEAELADTHMSDIRLRFETPEVQQ